MVQESTANSEVGSINKTPFINRAHVKALALDLAKYRGQKFTRVGMSFLARINDRVRAVVAEEVRQHPSRGKTLL